MRKFLMIILIATILLVQPVTVSAQLAIEIEELSVQFWPEYDQPNMLVIYSLVLPADLSYPLEIELPMPATIDAPFVVASGEQPNTIGDTKDYRVEAQGDQNMILFTANGPYVHYEYYDDGLVMNGDARIYNFDVTFPYTVKNTSYEVQQPIEAGNMSFSPDLANMQVKSDGLTYYNNAVSTSMDANEPLQLTIEYQKSSDILTQAAIQNAQAIELPPASDGTGTEASAREFSVTEFFSNASSLGVGLIVVGAGLVAIFFGYNMWESKRPKKHKRKQSGGKKRGSSGGGKSEIFCHTCGAAGSKTDKFCRSCGAKLRS